MRSIAKFFVAIVLVIGTSLLASSAEARMSMRGGSTESGRVHIGDGTPGVANCTVRYATQYVDNFGWGEATYLQRYFIYDKFYKPGGALFFYTGNEDDVTLYVNSTGAMWTNGPAFNALLVFAEHRFYGKSLPCAGGWRACGEHFTPDQAMADFANLIVQLKKDYRNTSATIVFGGSYGGMLSAWMRMRYPAIVDGAIASSAPIFCVSPEYQGETYWAVVSRDATAAGGSAPNCSANVHQAFLDMFTMMTTADGRAKLTSLMGLCSPLGPDDANDLGLFAQAAFDGMAMGDYGFPTSYISGTPSHPAPAWPMRVACQFMADAAPTPEQRITNLRNAIGVVSNTSQTVQCYDISQVNPSVYSAQWDFLCCTAGLPNEQPYFAAAGPPADMFYPQPVFTREKMDAHCMKNFGKKPRWDVLNSALGVEALRAASNIVLANGEYDPWHSGAAPASVLANVSATVVPLWVEEGGHHLDLFFPDPSDSASVIAVRKQQVEWMWKWVAEAQARQNDHSKE